MTAPNGRAVSASPPHVNAADNALASQHPGSATGLTDDRVRQVIGDLEVPFDPVVIEWRVTNTAQDKRRGQVMPYADQRAYSDRLHALVTPAGWTRKYSIHTSANFQRGKDQKTVAKILVTCELTIFGLGSHSATGEEWADDDNAGTSAEAQAFKRSCSCFGLGRYLYYFEGVWIDLDERKRPKKIPALPEWATPDGWRRGLRPNGDSGNGSKSSALDQATTDSALIRQIEAMARPLGRALYRGIMKSVAKAWTPTAIKDRHLQERVLAHMQGAERGLSRLKVALEKVGAGPLAKVLSSLKVRSLEHVDNLETLKQIVSSLESLGSKD